MHNRDPMRQTARLESDCVGVLVRRASCGAG
jgi:hypothetical protein